MSNVHPIHAPQPDPIDRFRSWWPKQDRHTQDAIREIVTGSKPGTLDDARAVLDFLNLKTGRNYRPVAANLNMIRARLKDTSIAQCKAVIAIKCREWRDDENMARYLRPATLFNRLRFEQYIGEVGNE